MALLARAVLLVVVTSSTADAAPAADAWLASLDERIVADLVAGKPLVVQVHVPLCDNHLISCGNARLGDGESPGDNLYWATSEGFVGWFDRRGSGWREVLRGDGAAVGERDVLDLRVWQRTVATPRAWRVRGAPPRFSLYVVAFAWRGMAIDRGLAAYWHDLYGTGSRTIALADHTSIAAGGAAQIVAYVGHNRLYDVDPPDWDALEQPGAPVRGTIAIACNTGPFMADHVAAATRVPLVFTRDFLMASAGAFEGSVLAFAAGGGYREIRRGAAHGYAIAGNHDEARTGGAFTNPADRRWGHWD
ncbi:MAG TPA: hypothetical protein VLX92_10030 [Kofleriaceae bacterium]|nr:hypothetical protein [Kofleriaceae bacterium]